MYLRFLAAALVLVALPSPQSLRAEDPPQAPAIRELPDGNVEINGIHVNRKARTVRFPARVNMDEGFVEYFLVTPRGKTHESVLVTDIQPNDLHIALLLLGIRLPADPATGQPPPDNIDDQWLAAAPPPAGDPVKIVIAFPDTGGTGKRVEAEKLLALGEKERRQPPAAGWIYTGSLIVEGRFLAQQEGSHISLIRDPAALINNSLPESARDDAWLVATGQIPKEGSAVTVEIAVAGPSGPSPAPPPTPRAE